jgi:rubrerythrin
MPKDPPPLPNRRAECPSCGEFIAWEGEPPTDCPICGEVLLPAVS